MVVSSEESAERCTSGTDLEEARGGVGAPDTLGWSRLFVASAQVDLLHFVLEKESCAGCDSMAQKLLPFQD